MDDTSPPSSSSHTAPRFYFGIPLRSRRSSLDWALVCRNLSRTLDSLRRQTSGKFGVLIACHEIPEVDTTGLNVEFTVADFDPPPAIDEKGNPGNDKATKKRMLGLALENRMREDTYYMHLDADDLIHPALVERALTDDNRRGYLLENGHMFDCATGRVGSMDLDHSAFWKHCGSCAILYLTHADLPEKLKDNRCYFTQFKRHDQYAATAASYQRPLAPLAEPMAIYLVNHGENDISAYRGKKDVKAKYIERARVTEPATLSRLLSDYPMLAEFQQPR